MPTTPRLAMAAIATVVLTTWGSLAAAGAASAANTWPTYHADTARSGATTGASLDPASPAWRAGLDGQSVYGQPVVADGRVFVGTEGDNLYALDAHDGHVLWHANIGAPFTNVSRIVGCGNVDPLGITSTPVVDTVNHTVYVVGEISTGGNLPVHHQLVGFNTFTGAVVRSTSADPPTSSDEILHLQQRAALALGNGRVYVGYGGFAGDCGTYHGWVIGVSEAAGPGNLNFNVTPQAGKTGGAVWQGGGGPSLDAAGNVYVTTGNENAGGPAPWTESVVKLGPDLNVLRSFKDPVASGDADLGSGDATLLPDGDLFAVGKDQVGYLLRQSDLGLLASLHGVCGSDPDGGEAYDAATSSIYIPCRDGGIQQVKVGASSLSFGWHGGAVNGAPILVNGELWAVTYGSGLVQELDAASGGVRQQFDVGSVPSFTSPSAALGLLLIGTNHGVVAYQGPAGPPGPAPQAGYWLAAADGGIFSFGDAQFYGSTGNIHLNRPVVGIAATPNRLGYWFVASDGGVFNYGDATFHGSTASLRLNAPIVGMAPTPSGAGYWLVAADGGVFSFGDAHFYGSTGSIRLNRPIVGIAPTGSGHGYWLVASDGGIFAYGDARFAGSTGSIHLNRPVVGMAATPSGLGYRLVASDGGIFAFGDARFAGSTGSLRLNRPIVGMAATRTGLGYWLVASDGGIFAFGDAGFFGSTGSAVLNAPVVGMASRP